MNNASQYARALFELVTKNPSEGKTYLHNLRGVLASRGHEKLLPRVLSAYEKLILRQERLAMHHKVTPERERTRILLELYRTLVA